MHTRGDSTDAEQIAGGSSPDPTLDVSDAFMLLKNERRRQVLSILREKQETTLADLTEQIAAAETGQPPGAVSSDERKRVYVSLYQCHLPKLDDHGVIEYDSDRGDVRRTPLASTLEEYLPDDDDPDASHPRLAGAACGVGAVSLVGVVLAPTVGPAVLWGALASSVLLIGSLVALADEELFD